MRNLRKSIRSVERVIASVKELHNSIPPDPSTTLTPKTRACLEEIKSTRTPAQIYELMISDESPFPESPGSGVTVDDDPEIALTNAFEAYRAELESGAKVIQMRQVFKRLQGIVK